MSGTVHRFALPGSVEEVLNHIEREAPVKLMVLMWDAKDECTTAWTPMSLMEVAWALRVLEIRLDMHMRREVDDWIPYAPPKDTP